MFYKIALLAIFLFITSCENKSTEIQFNKNFEHYSNKGFALIYSDDLFKDKIITKKIDKKSLVVFNNKLPKDTPVRITNLLNGKNLIAKVGVRSKYPIFYNSVISFRIVNDLNIDLLEPYIQIQTLKSSNTFVANKTKTFNEEKKVANKAPVDDISIKNISLFNEESKKVKTIKKHKDKKINNFKYIIKFADLFFEDSAIMLKNRLLEEFKIKDINIKKMSKNNYRVYKGPFINLDSIKKEIDNIVNVDFDNIEILKL
tara:strand:- start:630 stop:1403 length:774 start_codon:yes stop_codon:yes gene_type:complete